MERMKMEYSRGSTSGEIYSEIDDGPMEKQINDEI
jgi:hypothetical protein